MIIINYYYTFISNHSFKRNQQKENEMKQIERIAKDFKNSFS